MPVLILTVTVPPDADAVEEPLAEERPVMWNGKEYWKTTGSLLPLRVILKP